MDMADFTGKFKQQSTEKRDLLVKKLGLPEMLAKQVINSDAVLEIQQNGNQYNLKYIGKDKAVETKFKLGEEFTYSPFGMPVVGVASRQGDKITIKQKTAQLEMTSTLTLSGKELTTTVTVGDVTSTTKYKKQ